MHLKKSQVHESNTSTLVSLKRGQEPSTQVTFLVDGKPLHLGRATLSQVDEIFDMINDYAKPENKGNLVPVARDEVEAWVSKGLDFIVMDKENRVIAHTAVDCWPKDAEKPASRELRSVLVADEYRGKSVYTWLTVAVIEEMLAQDSKATLIEVKGGEHGCGLLKALGFEKYDYAKAQELGMDFPGLAEGEWVVYGLTKTPEYESRMHEVKLGLSIRV